VRATGAVIRAQGPLIAHINDDPAVWAKLWKMEVKLGLVPYYMFVERDTGARNYFEVPLARAWEIYQQAIQQVSGLARTARGPSMSASPGKVEIQGVTEIAGEKVFVLRFIQGRNPGLGAAPLLREVRRRGDLAGSARARVRRDQVVLAGRVRRDPGRPPGGCLIRVSPAPGRARLRGPFFRSGCYDRIIDRRGEQGHGFP